MLPASRLNGGLVAGDAEFGQGTYAPLGGAGGPPRRSARHLPVEREGTTQFVAVDDIVAVHANAHYSYIYDGTSKLFCPLAIGDVESRLDADRFIRVHRSHIINISFVAGLKWAGDNGVVELAGEDHHTVPVSRSRIGGLKSRLGGKVGDDRVLEVEGEGRVVFRYAPGDNPNGSVRDIAGIMSEKRNVMGLMPHPECVVDPLLGPPDGLPMFQSLVEALS